MEWLKNLVEKHTKEGVLDTEALIKDVNSEFPKYAVPKEEFNRVNDTKKDLEQQIKDRDKQLKDLGEKVKDNEDLSKQIKDLQVANAQTKSTYEAKIKDMTIDSAIKAKLNDTKYPDLLAGKFDRSKIVVSEDGTIAGVEEQLKNIKETYKELFTPTVTGKAPNNAFARTGSKQITKEQFDKMSYKEKNKLFQENRELYDTFTN